MPEYAYSIHGYFLAADDHDVEHQLQALSESVKHIGVLCCAQASLRKNEVITPGDRETEEL